MFRNLFSGTKIELDKGVVFLFPNIKVNVSVEPTINKKFLKGNRENISFGYILYHGNKNLIISNITKIEYDEKDKYYCFNNDDYKYYPNDKKKGKIQYIYIPSTAYTGYKLLSRRSVREISKINNLISKTTGQDGEFKNMTGSGKPVVPLEVILTDNINKKHYFIFNLSFQDNSFIINNIIYKNIIYSLGQENTINNNKLYIKIATDIQISILYNVISHYSTGSKVGTDYTFMADTHLANSQHHQKEGQ